MVYRFFLLSDEIDNFKREIQISSQASFLDFHKEILKCTGYDTNQLYSFFTCDKDWNKEKEITLFEMDTSSEEDCYVMESTLLEDLIEEERQKLFYVFDMLEERVFYIELGEIITGKNLKDPICTKSIGQPPNQIKDFLLPESNTTTDLDENFYGDDAYNDEELDGLEGNLFDESSGDERF